MTDDLLDVAFAVGVAHYPAQPVQATPTGGSAAAGSEGRTGRGSNTPGAVPFALPPTPPVPSFD